MNCLFTLKHKSTERVVKIYGVERDIETLITRFLVWNKNSGKFMWVSESEFEPLEYDFLDMSDGSYEEK